MSFREAQQAVDEWIGQYKEGYFSPLTNLVVICLANSQHIDLDGAFAEMLAKVKARDDARWTKKAR